MDKWQKSWPMLVKWSNPTTASEQKVLNIYTVPSTREILFTEDDFIAFNIEVTAVVGMRETGLVV